MKKYDLFNLISLISLLAGSIVIFIVALYAYFYYHFSWLLIVVSILMHIIGIVFNVLEYRESISRWKKINAQCDLLIIRLQIRKMMLVHDTYKLLIDDFSEDFYLLNEEKEE